MNPRSGFYVEVTNDLLHVLRDITQEEYLEGPEFTQAVRETFMEVGRLANKAKSALRVDAKRKLAEQFEHVAQAIATFSNILRDYNALETSLLRRRFDKYKAHHQPSIDPERTLWQNFFHNKPLRPRDSQEDRNESTQIITRSGYIIIAVWAAECEMAHQTMGSVSEILPTVFSYCKVQSG